MAARALLALALALGLTLAQASPGGAQDGEPVDLELLLLADATSSIDAVEMAIQRRGYAAAMLDAGVLRAIRSGGEQGRIAVAYVEWASARRQEVVVDWMVIDGAAAAEVFAGQLLVAPRRVRGVNAIGAALMRGLALIEGNRFEGRRKVIDLSGDSAWNPRRPTLGEARAAAVAAGVGINGLAVLCRQPCSGRQGAGNLEQQFSERLISGPGAFVVTADGRDAFAQAVRRKLILEIAGPAAPPRLAGAQAAESADCRHGSSDAGIVRVKVEAPRLGGDRGR
jgi:hypothetical protein